MKDWYLKLCQLLYTKGSTKNHPKKQVVWLLWYWKSSCFGGATSSQTPNVLPEALKGQRNLLPRKIRDWIGTDPQLRENTQQIVKGWDVEGIERSKWNGCRAGLTSMDRRKRGKGKNDRFLTFEGAQILHSRLYMSCAMRLSRLRNC